jgi:hypothetical protein
MKSPAREGESEVGRAGARREAAGAAAGAGAWAGMTGAGVVPGVVAPAAGTADSATEPARVVVSAGSVPAGAAAPPSVLVSMPTDHTAHH